MHVFHVFDVLILFFCLPTPVCLPLQHQHDLSQPLSVVRYLLDGTLPVEACDP
jgi:hypothetical protein